MKSFAVEDRKVVGGMRTSASQPDGEEKDEVGRKKTELGAEREAEWDKIEVHRADERWGC